MSDITALQEQIRWVARAREQAQKLADEKVAKLKAWEAENELFLDAVKSAAEYRNEQENQLREMTLLVYAETGNKKPCEGVGVREITKFQYDPKEAFQWGIKHDIALKLDVAAFEKIAKASPLEFVTVEVVSQATIATDLSEVLK